MKIVFTLPFFILFDLQLCSNALQQSKEADKVYQIKEIYTKVEKDWRLKYVKFWWNSTKQDLAIDIEISLKVY